MYVYAHTHALYACIVCVCIHLCMVRKAAHASVRLLRVIASTFVQTDVHVERDSETWMPAFNLALSLLSYVVSFVDNVFKLPPPPMGPCVPFVNQNATVRAAAVTVLSSCMQTLLKTSTRGVWAVNAVSDRWLGELAIPAYVCVPFY